MCKKSQEEPFLQHPLLLRNGHGIWCLVVLNSDRLVITFSLFRRSLSGIRSSETWDLLNLFDFRALLTISPDDDLRLQSLFDFLSL